MRKKRSEPKRFLENIRTSSVEKLEQTTRYDENVTYIKPRKVPNEGADEVGTKNPEQLLLKMLFSLREKKQPWGTETTANCQSSVTNLRNRAKTARRWKITVVLRLIRRIPTK
jgi:hypothetical protein